MKKHVIHSILAGLLLVSVISCASAPKTAEQSVAPAKIDITQAKAAAEGARGKAMEIKAAVASKALFNQAETAYNAAKGFETAADAEKAIASYTSAADIYTKSYDDAVAKKDAAMKAMSTAADERKTTEAVLAKAEDEVAGTNKGTGE